MIFFPKKLADTAPPVNDVTVLRVPSKVQILPKVVDVNGALRRLRQTIEDNRYL